MYEVRYAYQSKLSPWPSKLNHLLLSVLFYLLDCFDRWVVVPVGIELSEGFFPCLWRVGTVALEVAFLATLEALWLDCFGGVNVHRLTASPVCRSCDCLCCWCRHLTTLLGRGHLLCGAPSAFCLFESPIIVHTE